MPINPVSPLANKSPNSAVDGLDRAVGVPTAQHTRPLGEQHRPVGREGDAPGDRQVGDEGVNLEIRRGDLASCLPPAPVCRNLARRCRTPWPGGTFPDRRWTACRLAEVAPPMFVHPVLRSEDLSPLPARCCSHHRPDRSTLP